MNWVVFIGLSAAVSLAAADTAASDPGAILLDLQHIAAREYRLEGHMQVPVSSATAWALLSDYERLPTFVSSMNVSRIEKRAVDHLLLRQVATTRLFLFSKTIHVLLRVQETPFQRIAFEDVSGQDFETYRGSWEILNRSDGGVELIYRLHAVRKFAVPNFLAKKVMRSSVLALLEDVQQQMLR